MRRCRSRLTRGIDRARSAYPPAEYSSRTVILSLRRIQHLGRSARILRRASSYENGLRAWRTGRGSGGKSGCFGVGGFEMHGVTEALEAANGAADDVLPVAFVKVGLAEGLVHGTASEQVIIGDPNAVADGDNGARFAAPRAPSSKQGWQIGGFG